jgi:hypothetical protein
MTCSQCSHYDEINCFCWVQWEEISHADAEILSCASDTSLTEEDFEPSEEG